MSAPAPSMPTLPVPPRNRWASLAALGAHLLPSLVACALAGFLVGGIGGRLAMFVLRLTSRPEVIGVESDDGFVIGRVSIDTLNLLLGTTIGATLVVGPMYALLRLWLPVRWRAVTLALFFGLIGGATIVHPDGVDFQLLSPRALSIALFVALPATFGAALEPLRSFSERRMPRLPMPVLLTAAVLGSGWPLALGAGPIGLAIAVIAWGAVLLGPADRLSAALTSRPVTWIGRLAMGAIAGMGARDLVEDMQALL